MKIMICTTVNTLGGMEESVLADALAAEFKKCSAVIDTFYLPYTGDIISLPEQIFAYRLLSEIKEADMLVTIGYPACFVGHRNKVSFLFDMEPKIKELFNTVYGAVDEPVYRNIANVLRSAEKTALQEIASIYCSSKMLKDDILDTYGLNSELFTADFNIEDDLVFDDCIVTQTNLQSADRIELIVDAISQTDNKLVIFIPHAEEMMLSALQIRIKRLGIENRIQIIERPMGKHAIDSARLVVSVPIMARRIPGYVAEAIRSGIPVLTTLDSDALLEVIHNEKEGYIVQANKDAIAGFIMDKKLSVQKENSSSLNSRKQIEEIVKGLMECISL